MHIINMGPRIQVQEKPERKPFSSDNKELPYGNLTLTENKKSTLETQGRQSAKLFLQSSDLGLPLPLTPLASVPLPPFGSEGSTL
jgi:hypothetical protein